MGENKAAWKGEIRCGTQLTPLFDWIEGKRDILRSASEGEYSFDMTRRKSKLDIATEKAARIIEAHMETLPPMEAREMREEIHALARKSSRPANRGKASRSRKSGGPHPLSRVSAKSA